MAKLKVMHKMGRAGSGPEFQVLFWVGSGWVTSLVVRVRSGQENWRSASNSALNTLLFIVCCCVDRPPIPKSPHADLRPLIASAHLSSRRLGRKSVGVAGSSIGGVSVWRAQGVAFAGGGR